MNWLKIEEIICEPLTMCIKQILYSCGYDTFQSLKGISEQSLSHIENHINTASRLTIENLHCSHSVYYKSLDEFRLLPGHRSLIISLSKVNFSENEKQHLDRDSKIPKNASYVLKELINTAATIEKKCHEYSNIIRWFATYIFLLCGRSCYEVLNHNLPLPSTKTVRKCRHFSNKNHL